MVGVFGGGGRCVVGSWLWWGCGCGAPCAHLPYCLTSLPWVLLLLPQMKETIMNQEKLAKLQAQVRIGGKVGATSLPCPLDCMSPHARGALKTGVGSSPKYSQLGFSVLRGTCAAAGISRVSSVEAVCGAEPPAFSLWVCYNILQPTCSLCFCMDFFRRHVRFEVNRPYSK